MSKKRLQNGEKNNTANVMKNTSYIGVDLQVKLLFTWPFKRALIVTQRS